MDAEFAVVEADPEGHPPLPPPAEPPVTWGVFRVFLHCSSNTASSPLPAPAPRRVAGGNARRPPGPTASRRLRDRPVPRTPPQRPTHGRRSPSRQPGDDDPSDGDDDGDHGDGEGGVAEEEAEEEEEEKAVLIIAPLQAVVEALEGRSLVEALDKGRFAFGQHIHTYNN